MKSVFQGWGLANISHIIIFRKLYHYKYLESKLIIPIKLYPYLLKKQINLIC